MTSMISLETSTTSDTSENQELTRTEQKQIKKQMLNKIMVLYILNIADMALIAFFLCYDILVQPEPIMLSADIFYTLSLMLLMFAIKFRHGYCLGMSTIFQVAAFALKVGGYYYADNQSIKLVALMMMVIMLVFSLIPFMVFKYWNKIDKDSWLNKFDKQLKMNSYKNQPDHFQHD